MRYGIGTYLVAAFGVVMLLVVALGAIAFTSAERLSGLTGSLHDHPFAVTNAAANATAGILAMERSMKDVALARDSAQIDRAVAEVDRRESIVDGQFAILRERFLGDRNKVEEAYKAFAAWKAVRDDVIKLTRTGQHDEAAAVAATTEAEAIASIDRPLQELSEFAQKKAGEFMANANATASWTETLILASVLGAMALAAVAAFLTMRAISRPLVRLSAATKELGAGHFDVAVPSLGRRDEIGEIARSIATFKENGIERLRLEREALASSAAAEAERHRTEAERQKQASQTALVVRELATSLGKLSDGNLNCRLHEAFPGEYEKLRRDFNASMEKLQKAMLAIYANTHTARSGTEEISTAADDLSRRTEQQAATLEETAAALDEITATVNKTAEGAKHAREVVSAAKADAEQSSIVVRKAIEAMTSIDKSSKQVSQIIGVIDEIAFQTNLLALNAGVEAARAGEAGRGFAVVASEVRALAQRSAEAAKEIKGLISTSTAQVDSGVELVVETGKALERIIAQVAEINSVVSAIAASAQEQASGLQQVNTAMNQMDQVTQQNAAMVEETTAAAHSLANETQELGRLIGHFQMGETAATPVRRTVPKVTSAARPALKTVAARGTPAARKATPAEAGDRWEDF